MSLRASVAPVALGVLAAAATVAAIEARLGGAEQGASAANNRSARAAAETVAALRGQWRRLSLIRTPYLQFVGGGIVGGAAPLGELGGPEDLNVLFLDYLCGHCRADHAGFLDLVRSRPGERFYVAQAPVLGEQSAALARMAVSAAEAGTFAAAHEALMAGRFAPAPAGASTGETVDALLAGQALLASALGIRATPVYLLSGTLVFGTLRQYRPQGGGRVHPRTNEEGKS